MSSLAHSINGKVALSVGSLFGATVLSIYWLSKLRRSKKASKLIDMIEAFKKASVHIKDRNHVETLVCNLIQGGKEKLQVIADFDRTVTRFKDDSGQTCHTCHNALEDSDKIPAFYKEKALAMRDHYYAIEIDPQLTADEKYPYMVEWWTKAHTLLEKCQLNRSVIKDIVRDSQLKFREGCEWTFTSLRDGDVPTLVFSAGVGDIIEESLRQQGLMFENMRVVSNFMNYDNKGDMIGFKGELIHIYNKNESAVHKSDYFEKIRHRENVILLGDSLGDLRMSEGTVDCKNILKIGFLNDKVDKLLATYMDQYDIVLVSDETFDIPNAILGKVL